MPAKYVRPYSKGQKNDFRDAEAIAEAVQRPTMKFVATKTADQLDLQALHRVRERLVSQRTGIINQIRSSGPSVTRFNGSAPPRRSENDNPAGLQRDSDEVEYGGESTGVDAGTANGSRITGANCHADTYRQSDERHAIVT
jgi:hypothetical protein